MKWKAGLEPGLLFLPCTRALVLLQPSKHERGPHLQEAAPGPGPCSLLLGTIGKAGARTAGTTQRGRCVYPWEAAGLWEPARALSEFTQQAANVREDALSKAEFSF